MTKKKALDPKEKPQRKRFIEFAREHGAETDKEALERIFKEVAKPEPKKKASDDS